MEDKVVVKGALLLEVVGLDASDVVGLFGHQVLHQVYTQPGERVRVRVRGRQT
jgi:hypothetical protein